MTKTKLTATTPDGTTITRTTARPYTHVVLVKAPYAELRAQLEQTRQVMEERNDPRLVGVIADLEATPAEGHKWNVVTWTSRSDLAEKQAATYRNRGGEVVIVPVI